MKVFLSLLSLCFFAFAMQGQYITEDFEGAVEATDPAIGWIQESDLTPGYGWFYDTAMAFVISGTRSAVSYGSNDDWLISPSFPLAEDEEVGITFDYMTNPNSPMETSDLTVYIINTMDLDIEADGVILFSDDQLNSPLSSTISFNSTAASAGDYRLAFHAVTTADASLSIDNVYVGDVGMNVTESSENSITIYPNPSHGTFQVSGDDFIEVKLYSSTGSEVLRSNERILSTYDLSSGFYIAKVRLMNGQEVIKRVFIK